MKGSEYIGHTGGTDSMFRTDIATTNLIQLADRLFETLSLGVLIYNHEGALIYLNDAAALALGGTHTPEQILRGNIGAFSVEQPIVFDESGKLIPTHLYASRLASKGIATKDQLIRQRFTNGSNRWFSISSTPILGAGGSVEYVITSVENVTGQKLREDRVRFLLSTLRTLPITGDYVDRLREKAHLIVPNFADCCTINIVNPGGKLSRIVAAHRDQGTTARLQQIEEALHSETDGIEQVLRTGKPIFYPSITSSVSQSRSAAWPRLAHAIGICSAMILPIIARDAVLGVLSLAYAQSERQYTTEDLHFFEEYSRHLSVILENVHLFEELERRDKAKSTFIAALSHELRNPLAPIKSSLELLQIYDLPSEARECVSVIESQFDHMAHLLNDLLSVTRLSNGRITIETDIIPLHDLIEQTTQALMPDMRKHAISLHTILPKSPIFVKGDRTRLQQALTNLLHNAQKFTQPGGEVTVELAHNNRRAYLSVIDTGVGIPPEKIHTLFDIHFNTKHHGATDDTGLGIGLVVVKEIMRLHSGDVRAYSKGVGKGACFTLSLPLSPTQTPARAHTPLQSNKQVENKKILIVDDNNAAAHSIGLLLMHTGHHVELAHDGKHALTAAESFDPSHILLDIGLPDMDGYEVARQIRRNGGRSTLIALTGYGQEEDKEKARAAGFDYHLTKPVSVSDIEKILSQ